MGRCLTHQQKMRTLLGSIATQRFKLKGPFTVNELWYYLRECSVSLLLTVRGMAKLRTRMADDLQ